MPELTIRTPDDGTPWTDERAAIIATAHVSIDGELYPITAARIDGSTALLTVDTGAGGPDLEPGTATQAGVVE